MNKILAFFVGAVFVCAIVAAYPVLAIWAVNTLFGTSIAITLKTWLAAFVLMSIFGARAVNKKD
jgi:hypothetical protein